MDTRERALVLLGSGQPPVVVAQALGIDQSRVAQLLAEPEFARKVAELRFKNLQDHAARDQKYDSLEDQLVDKLKDVLDYIVKPMELIRALKEINGMKRRGVLDPTAGQQFNTVVQLQLPNTVKAKFTLDQNGIIVSVGERAMTTMPANVLLKEIEGERLESTSDAGPSSSTSGIRQLEGGRAGSSTEGARSQGGGSPHVADSEFLRAAEAEIAALGI